MDWSGICRWRPEVGHGDSMRRVDVWQMAPAPSGVGLSGTITLKREAPPRLELPGWDSRSRAGARPRAQFPVGTPRRCAGASAGAGRSSRVRVEWWSPICSWAVQVRRAGEADRLTLGRPFGQGKPTH